MRTTETNIKEKSTQIFRDSVSNIKPIYPTIVVLILTLFERKGGET